MNYNDFLAGKRLVDRASGFDPIDVSAGLLLPLKPFQHDMVRWACRRGRAALLSDCGTGKTPMQLQWARLVHAHMQGRVLILAPLAVAAQTKREG